MTVPFILWRKKKHTHIHTQNKQTTTKNNTKEKEKLKGQHLWFQNKFQSSSFDQVV